MGVGLAERVVELEVENAQLRELIVRLEARIVELERQLGKHSGNWSLPPSADSQAQREARPAPTKRRQGQRRQGKQPGAPGAHLERVATPDRTILHRPNACRGCGAGLGDAPVVGVESRQVFDLPDRRAEVTDHRAEKRRCRCGCETTGVFPAEATAPACWGPQVRAVAVYLLVRHHRPIARVAEILSDLVGASVSTGWLAGLTGQATDGLGSFIDDVKDRLTGEPVAHADETSCRVAGVKQWFHVLSTALITVLAVHTKRGRTATDAIGVLPAFRGVLVHDRWAPYWTYPGIRHAICNAHIVRDLAAIGEADRYRGWAGAMVELLIDAKRRCDFSRYHARPRLARGQQQWVRARYDTLVAAFFAAYPTPADGWPKGSYDRDAHNLAVALRDHRDEVLRFTRDLNVPFDNNQAERDLRMAKLQQKVSGSFRTEHGAHRFATVRSYIETGRKHGHNPLDLLTQLFNAHPWTIPTSATA